MQGRTFSSSNYRYGFNSKEKEVDFTADNYDFGARIYDGRIGRWLAVDPLFNDEKNNSFTPYNYGINSPVYIVDRDGEIWWVAIGAAVGGVVNAGIGIVKGESLAKIGGRFVKGAVIGAAMTGIPILAAQAGVVGAAAFQATLYASPIVYGIGEGAGQLTRFALSGGKEKFNGDEFTESISYAIPETIVDLLTAGGGTMVSKSIKKHFTENITDKNLSKEIQRQIKKDIRKKVKNDIREKGGDLTKKELEKVTNSLYKNVMESTSGKVSSKISKSNKKVDIMSVTIPAVVSGSINDQIEK